MYGEPTGKEMHPKCRIHIFLWPRKVYSVFIDKNYSPSAINHGTKTLIYDVIKMYNL